MRNYVMTGDRLTVAAPYAVTSGQGLQVGAAFGIATGPAAQGANVECAMEGVFDLPKATGAISQWQALYWDNTARNITTTASGNNKVGFATQAAASGDPTVRANLTGQV